jgi:hypothetical protein
MVNKTYSFEHQELIGKKGEEILDQWFSSMYKILDVSTIKKYQEIGIDRVLARPDGSMINVEYKFDLASLRTGNLFFETISVDNRNLPGWGWSSQADYWIFLLVCQEIIVVEPQKLRFLIWQLRTEIKEVKVSNQDYNTWGIPIKIDKVRKIACYCKKIEIKI